MMSASTTIENYLNTLKKEEVPYGFKKRIDGTAKRRKRKEKIKKLYSI